MAYPPHLLNGIKLIYVGRLDANKNILPTLRETDFASVRNFTIVGDGELYREIKTLALANPKIKLLGRLTNRQSLSLMAEHDYLILPSLYDGWGAVVNEALSVGTRVLCSCACGASILLDGTSRGEAFTQKNKRATIKKWSERGALTRADRETIKSWAASRISGSAAARYFLETISAARPPAPWLQ